MKEPKSEAANHDGSSALASAHGSASDGDSEIGARWRKNSSLEEWFPFSAQKLKSLEAECGNAAAIIVKQNQELASLRHALELAQYLTEHCAEFRWGTELGKPKWSFGEIADEVARAVKTPNAKLSHEGGPKLYE